MRFKYRPISRLLSVLSIILILSGLFWYAAKKNYPIVRNVLSDSIYGNITVARPFIIYHSLVVVFADTKKIQGENLAKRLAQLGAAVAVIDTAYALQALTDGEKHCLNPDRIPEPFEILSKWANASKGKLSIFVGIGDGALLPFFCAATQSGHASRNLSVDFSIRLPENVESCPPFAWKIIDGHRELTSSPALQEKWRAVWTEEPDESTAIFVRGLSNAETVIEPYDTPLDNVTVDEVAKMLSEENQTRTNALPVVEAPAKKPNDTVTVFYSGDGGWRDLDRAVAGLMAEQGYPVVGVDALRYFWSTKTPQEAADDLSDVMKHYRKIWKAKNFVLAGYSFGADILPAIYNRLSESDKKSVSLLILLALSKTADFEIHVSGWIEENANGVPIWPELKQIQTDKIVCIYGAEEIDDTACTGLSAPEARVLELPGGHHFDNDYPKLVKRLINIYQQVGLKANN